MARFLNTSVRSLYHSAMRQVIVVGWIQCEASTSRKPSISLGYEFITIWFNATIHEACQDLILAMANVCPSLKHSVCLQLYHPDGFSWNEAVRNPPRASRNYYFLLICSLTISSISIYHDPCWYTIFQYKRRKPHNCPCHKEWIQRYTENRNYYYYPRNLNSKILVQTNESE